MSHIETGTAKILDLAALEAAAKAMGSIFVRGQTSHRWYGKFMGDSKPPEGVKVSDYGKCSHVIKVPGINYEIGVVAQKDGSYVLAYDSWGQGTPAYRDDRDPNRVHDGALLTKHFGDKLAKLQQQYNRQVVTKQARAKGYSVLEKTLPNGSIKLQLIHA